MSGNDLILLVVNPVSGGLDKREIINHLEERCKLEQKYLSVHFTTGKNDKEEISALVEKLSPERILIAGGDGTIKLLAEIINKKLIPIGIFPAGSANGLAENLDLPDELEEIASVALGNTFIDLDCINLNGELCLHISDLGLNAELIRNYEEGNIRGKLGYLIQSLPTLIKSNFPFEFSITSEQQTLRKKAFLVGIANARRYGTGATINPKGRYDDGKFEILVFKEFNIPQILRTFQENVSFSEDFLEIYSASHARIECQKLVPFQIDGEYRGETKTVVAEISPIKIRIAVPGKVLFP